MNNNYKISFFLLLLFLGLSNSSFSQDDHFQNGMSAYNEKDYETALASFTTALDDKYLMKGRDVPRAYNFRAKSVAEYFALMLQNKNSSFISDNPNILVNAFEDLDQAIRFDDGKCHGLIADTKGQLLDVTFQFGKTIADSLRVDRGTNDPKTDSLILLVIDELLILKDLSEDSYEINDLLGLLQYKEGKGEEAISYFNESEEIYQNKPPVLADYNHVYNYYYSALINYHEFHEFDKALTDVKKARKFITSNFSSNDEAQDLDAKLEALEFQIKLLKN